MRRLLMLPAALTVLAAAPAPQARPASELIQEALSTAKPGGRTVLVAFHASWCSWCRRLEGVLAKPAVKEVMDRRFVTLWLTIMERGPKQELDNPGAADLYQRWTGGAKAGIPFCLVLDGKGDLKASSIRPLSPGAAAENIGYPGSPDEIKAFVALLREGAPAMTDAEAAVITRELDAAKPAQ